LITGTRLHGCCCWLTKPGEDQIAGEQHAMLLPLLLLPLLLLPLLLLLQQQHDVGDHCME
jgi:hypothetical protein